MMAKQTESISVASRVPCLQHAFGDWPHSPLPVPGRRPAARGGSPAPQPAGLFSHVVGFRAAAARAGGVYTLAGLAGPRRTGCRTTAEPLPERRDGAAVGAHSAHVTSAVIEGRPGCRTTEETAPETPPLRWDVVGCRRQGQRGHRSPPDRCMGVRERPRQSVGFIRQGKGKQGPLEKLWI